MSFLREIILTITSHKDAIGVRVKKMILISNQKTLLTIHPDHILKYFKIIIFINAGCCVTNNLKQVESTLVIEKFFFVKSKYCILA